MNDAKDIVAKLAIEIGADPALNVVALVEVAARISVATGKSPIDGCLSLMTAAVFILDTHAIAHCPDDHDVDYQKLVARYMEMATTAWNTHGVLFKGVDGAELDKALQEYHQTADNPGRLH